MGGGGGDTFKKKIRKIQLTSTNTKVSLVDEYHYIREECSSKAFPRVQITE